jgi:hypothetical protein
MAIWIPDDDDIDRLVTVTKELIAAFPERIDDDEHHFNIPAYLVTAVQDALAALEE